MRRGFLLPKPGAPPISSPLVTSHHQPESLHSPTTLSRSPGAPEIVPTRPTTSSAIKTVKIPTDMYHEEVPPTIPSMPDPVPLGSLRYVEYPQGPSVPSHLVTGVMLFNGMEEHIQEAFPGFVKPFTAPSPPVYKCAPAKGAGLGVIATTDIAPGHVIMRERPLLVLPIAVPMISMRENRDVYEFMVCSMRPENREAVYALSNAQGSEAHSCLKGIVYTNALGLSAPIPGHSGRYAALGRDLSRINHSCSPNAIWFWDLETLTLTVTAFMPIRAGEEVTITYAEIDCPYLERQEALKLQYNFTCKCPACEQDNEGRFKNDLWRICINLFDLEEQRARDAEAFDKWLADGAPIQHDCRTAIPLEPHKFAQEIERRNGFVRASFAFDCMFVLSYFKPNLWEPVLARLVKGHSVLEDEENVRKHALLAACLKKAHTGSDGGWTEVARRPRDTDWWGKLGAKRVR